MKRIILTIILIFIGTGLFAQNNENIIGKRPTNIISLNLFGDASMVSINYEKLFIIKPTIILSGKIGFGYNEEFQLCVFGPCSSPPDQYFTITNHITGDIGKRKLFFEFGLGGTILLGNTTQEYSFYPMVGFRLLPLSILSLIFVYFLAKV